MRIVLSQNESDDLRAEAERHIQEDHNQDDRKTLWVPESRSTLDWNHERLMGEEGTCQLLGVPRIPKGDVDCIFRGWTTQIKCYAPRSSWHIWLLAKPVKNNKAGTTCQIIVVCFYHGNRVVSLARWISRRRFYEECEFNDRMFKNKLPIHTVSHRQCNKPAELFTIPWANEIVKAQEEMFQEGD